MTRQEQLEKENAGCLPFAFAVIFVLIPVFWGIVTYAPHVLAGIGG